MKVVSLASLTMNEKKLVDIAVDAQRCARAGYSHFKVGAAVGMIAANSIIIGDGCNGENCIYVVTHAEQAAIARLAMMLEPAERMRIDIVALALFVEKDEQHAVPCGFCRQLIREFGHDGTLIYGAKLNAEGRVWQVEAYTLGELLPYSFGPNNLNQ